MMRCAIWRPAPISEEEVERLEPGKIVGALGPALAEVVVGDPIEIPHVGQRQDVAVDGPCRLPRDVRGPVAVGRRLDRAPPDDDRAEDKRKDPERDPAAPREQRPYGGKGNHD